MNEEEKKTIEKFIEKCYKYDESVEIKGISVGEEYRMLNTVCKALNLIEKLQKENEELRAKWDKDTHILQNKLDYANADRIDLAQQNKELRKENEGLKIKNNAIKRESEAYAEHMIRLDNELNLEKEKSKYEWIRQNCLSQELVNKLYIPIQKVKDKIEELEEEIKPKQDIHQKLCIEVNKIGTETEYDYAMEELSILDDELREMLIKKRVLQELLEESE